MKGNHIIIFILIIITQSCFKPNLSSGDLALNIKRIEKTTLINKVVFSKFHKNICHNFGINQDTTKSFKSLEILNQFVFSNYGYNHLQKLDLILENELIGLFPCIAREKNSENDRKLIMVMILKDNYRILWSFYDTSKEKIIFYCSRYSAEKNEYVISAETQFPN